jgi:hypothetical protein
MAWADPATESLISDELQYLVPAYTSKKVAERIKKPDGLWAAIPSDPLAERNGNTATFPRYADISPQDASTVLTEGVNPAPTDVVTGKISVTVVEKGGVVAIPSLAEKTIVDGAQAIGDIVSDWGIQSMEMWAACNFVPYLQGITTNSTDQGTYVKDSVSTTAGSTLLVNDTARTEATNFWAGGTLTITDPYKGNFGESKLVASSVQNVSITVSAAFSQTVASGTLYHVADQAAVTSADVLTLWSIRAAQKAIRRNGGFGPGRELPGGGYTIVLDPVTEADIQTDLISVFQYKPTEAVIRNYPDGGKIAMCRPVITNIPFRSAITGAGTYASAGAIHYTPIFGPKVMSKLPLGQMDVRVVGKARSTGGTSNPLERFATTSWEFVGAGVLRNAAWGAAVYSGDN